MSLFDRKPARKRFVKGQGGEFGAGSTTVAERSHGRMIRKHWRRKNGNPCHTARQPQFPASDPRPPVSPLHPSNFILQTSAQRASSLVTTLLVLVILSTIVVAFLQSMSVERSVARSVKNRFTAELAAQSGLSAAQTWIDSAISTNRNFIVSATTVATNYCPVVLIGLREATVDSNMFPMISGNMPDYLSNRTSPGALSNYLFTRTNLNSSNTVNLNVGGSLIQPTNSTTYFRAPWVNITNSDGSAAARYAFIVMDEQARFNPFLHQGTSGSARTNYGRSAAEIRVDSPGAPFVGQLAALTNFVNGQTNVITPATLAQYLGASCATNKHLLSIHRAVDEDVIPAGYTDTNSVFANYADSGKPKYRINDLATNTAYGATAEQRALNIAGIISCNLTGFGKRDPSMVLSGEDPTGQKYARRLAASIVDYIDTDSTPTLVDGEPAGRELAAYVVGVGERNTWVSETGSGPYSIAIQSEFFAQLWNPFTFGVSGTISFGVFNRQTINLAGGNPSTDFQDFQSASMQVDLRPNEFKVIKVGAVTQNISGLPVRPSSSISNYPTWVATSSSSSSLTGHPAFSMTWNGVVLDMNRRSPMFGPAAAGLVRTSPGGSFGPVGALRWNFNFTPANSPNTVADPRGNWLSQSDWAGFINIANALWQGRESDSLNQAGENFNSKWANRDYVRANPANLGQPIASAGADPTSVPSQYAASDATNAPAYIANAAMVSIGELGNVFDPAQVDDSGAATSGGSPANFTRAMGGRSLRVGQPEFSFASTNNWDQPGRRAIQLLDLFSVNPLGTNYPQYGLTNSPVMRGRVNVNTAPAELLRAVYEGVAITNDAGISKSTNISGQIADAIIAARPYSRISDLNKALAAFVQGTNYSPAIANTSGNALAVMDQGREELFSRTVNLLGTQSRAFRIYVVGQSLDANQHQVGQSVIEASLELAPSTNSTGLRQITTYKRQE